MSKQTKRIETLQGGPLPTPLAGVTTPVIHLFSASYRGPITPFTTRDKAHIVITNSPKVHGCFQKWWYPKMDGL